MLTYARVFRSQQLEMLLALSRAVLDTSGEC